MGTITKIEIQKKNKQRVNLFVDDEFVCGLSVETLVKRRLKTGGTVLLDDLKDAVTEDEKNGAFHDLLKALSVKKLTIKEAEDGLTKKEYLHEAVLYAIEKGKEYGYLNDEAYVEEYLSVYGERCGKIKLKHDLVNRGVDKNLLEDLLADADDSDAAYTVLAKYLKGEAPTDYKTKSKAVRYMASKGFSYSAVGKALDRLASGEPNDNDEE